MNTQHNPESDPLDRALRQWKVDTALPPRFQELVWQRIARAEAQPDRGVRARLWHFFVDVLPRPGIAVGYLAMLLALGLAAGSFASQAKASRIESELSARYVQSIDPFRLEASNP